MELMAPFQTDRASWAVGRADWVATRIRSPKPGQGGGVAGPRWQGGLKKPEEELAAWVARYLSSYGQLGKGEARQKPESGWGEKTHHYTRWFILSEFCRDRDWKTKLSLTCAKNGFLVRRCPESAPPPPPRILWFSSLLGSWPSSYVYRER